MFKGRFSNQRFGLAEHMPTFAVVSFFREKIDGLIGLGSEFVISHRYDTSVTANILATQGFACKSNYVESVSGTALLNATYSLCSSLGEDITGIYMIGSNYHLHYIFDTQVENNSYFGKNISASSLFVGDIHQKTCIGKNIFVDGNITEIVSCITDVSVLEKEILSLNITLPPNTEVKIDSEQFTVLLQSQNIIQTHKGDWIYLDRDLVDLRIDSGTGGMLIGKLLYKERYL